MKFFYQMYSFPLKPRDILCLQLNTVFSQKYFLNEILLIKINT